MPDNQNMELAKYRLAKSGECSAAANSLLMDGLYAHSVNRSYYAIFHAIRAVLALMGVDFKKHSGVILGGYMKIPMYPMGFWNYMQLI